MSALPSLRICTCGESFEPRHVTQRHCSRACGNLARSATLGGWGDSDTEPGPFGKLLREYREVRRMSRNSLALECGVDPSYQTRLEAGDREPPRRHIVEALARVLRLTALERNRLLTVAGYSVVDDWTEPMQAFVEVLADERLSIDERDAFGAVVLAIAARWRPSIRANGGAS